MGLSLRIRPPSRAIGLYLREAFSPCLRGQRTPLRFRGRRGSRLSASLVTRLASDLFRFPTGARRFSGFSGSCLLSFSSRSGATLRKSPQPDSRRAIALPLGVRGRNRCSLVNGRSRRFRRKPSRAPARCASDSADCGRPLRTRRNRLARECPVTRAYPLDEESAGLVKRAASLDVPVVTSPKAYITDPRQFCRRSPALARLISAPGPKFRGCLGCGCCFTIGNG